MPKWQSLTIVQWIVWLHAVYVNRVMYWAGPKQNQSNISKGAGIAQSVEALYFTTELHTSSVWVQVQQGTQYLYEKIKKIRRNVYSGWLSPSGRGGEWTYRIEPRPDFPMAYAFVIIFSLIYQV